MNDDPAAAWLPLGEAAHRLGISVDAVRARIRRGLLEGRRGNDGKVSVLVTAQAPTDRPQVDDEALSRFRLDLDEARAEADHWQQRAHEAELAVARAEERVRSAEAVALANVATAKAEVEAKEQVVAEVRRALEHERARAERLEALLNRPWWTRWFGARR
jgi:hypothetical protein